MRICWNCSLLEAALCDGHQVGVLLGSRLILLEEVVQGRVAIARLRSLRHVLRTLRVLQHALAVLWRV